MTNMNKIQVRGVMVYLSDNTINRFLHGPTFTPPTTSLEFFYTMWEREKQRPWLDKIIAEGEMEWLNNACARIFKDSITQKAIFWWGVIRTRLMPTAGDNIIGNDRAVLVAGLMSNYPLNFGEIIPNDMKI